MSFSEKLQEALKEWAPALVVPISLYVAYKLLNKIIPGAHNLPALDVKNKVVVITGASSGLGKSLAFELYKRGAKVILLARSTDKLKQICQELKETFPLNQNEPTYYYFDITEPDQAPWAEIPKVDILINNAGLANRGSCADTPIDLHRQVMETNFFGHVEVTNLLLPKLDPKGCIVVTSSVQGKVALPYRSSYGASKHALQGYFDSLRAEHKNLHVLVVSAGYINTGFGSRAIDPSGKATGIEDQNQKKSWFF
ncbi:unnamed protein product [Caenorhabditis sp. 36 PRJEB53466]|nr:unnamed protein product [Caenorhabditis sp. 36 PRJEB53466]